NFGRLLDDYRRARGIASPAVLDVGCSDGVNAALLKYGLTMRELYDRYGGADVRHLARDSLLARDRELTRSVEPADDVRILGLDASEPALSSALEAGFLDCAVHADLAYK